MFRFVSNFLHKKFGVYKRDVFIFFIFVFTFFLSKDFILNAYFKFYSKEYFKINVNKINNINCDVVLKENIDLKKILDIKVEGKKNFITAKVLTNIYFNTSFWIMFNSKNLKFKINDPVWCVDPVFGPRLIGFVDSILDNLVKVRPITHYKSRFSVLSSNGIGFLVRGKFRDLEILLSNASSFEDCSKVYYEDLFVGIYSKDYIKCPDFARIQWVCIYI